MNIKTKLGVIEYKVNLWCVKHKHSGKQEHPNLSFESDQLIFNFRGDASNSKKKLEKILDFVELEKS